MQEREITNRLGSPARTVEWTVAILLTLASAALHFNVMQHAGPLWRDEISSLRLATMPTLAGAWSSLVYDPVPVLFFAILRLWHGIGLGATDNDLRHLGFLVGLGTLCAIWFAAWTLRKSPPSWALLLFGLSPVAFVWADTMRAYGIGCLFAILMFSSLWKVVCERPSLRHIFFATAAALLTVQSLFSNSLLVSAAIAGAVLVAFYRRWWRAMGVVISIGFVAALSLLPYVPILHETQSWSSLCRSPITVGWICNMMLRATASGGMLAAALWALGGGVVCLLFVWALIAKSSRSILDSTEVNLVLFAGTTLIVALVTNVCFFRWVGWATSLWYYLPLMATAVFCFEAVATLVRKSAAALFLQMLFIAVAAAVLAPTAYQASHVRLTNADLVANTIAGRAQAQDLVVVDYYLYAISFNRYYHGQAPWLSVPNISDATLHRWDLLKEAMNQPNPIQPILKRIDETLLAGHEVYIVGLVPPTHAADFPPDLPIASQNSFGWILWPYVRRWTDQVAYTAQVHSAHGTLIPIRGEDPTSNAERIRAAVVSGWKDGSIAAPP
jgi:hypothetical protein